MTMPLFIVETTATTEIRERWAVQADTPEDAQDKVYMGEAALLGEENLGTERDRDWYGTRPAGTDSAAVREALEENGVYDDAAEA